MKQFKSLVFPILTLSLCLTIFSGCGSKASNTNSSVAGTQVTSISLPISIDTAEDTKEMDTVYRGVITSMEENHFTVQQAHGYNYGAPEIVFSIDVKTQTVADGIELAPDTFVEVTYNGILTRSMPPQAAADIIKVISPLGDDTVLNGTINTVEKGDEGWSISVTPLEAAQNTDIANNDDANAVLPLSSTIPENTIILHVPFDALEELTENDLVAGTKVSAVTMGIATMSIPPQMPVYKLLPYNEES